MRRFLVLSPTGLAALALACSLRDNGSFFNDFNQGFTPGSTLSFQVDLTTSVGTTAPDEFSFALFEDYGTANQQEIPTTDPSGANTLATATINNPSQPAITPYGGNGNSLTSPDVSPVPEPRTLVLFAIGLALLATGRCWQHRRSVASA